MDSKYPVCLLYENQSKKGHLKELTLRELERSTSVLYPNEYRVGIPRFVSGENVEVHLEDDEAVNDEYEAVNDDDSEDDDDNDDDDDDSKDENGTAAGDGARTSRNAFPVRVLFSPRKEVICAPKPVQFRKESARVTSAIVSWKLDARHKLDSRRLSSLEFEIVQFEPVIAGIDVVAKVRCHSVKLGSREYRVKLSGLSPSTNYKFGLRSVLFDEEERQFVRSAEEFLSFATSAAPRKRLDRAPSTAGLSAVAPPTDLQVLALYADRCVLAWNHMHHNAERDAGLLDYEYCIAEKDVFASSVIAATEDSHFVCLNNLAANTQYTFVCTAKLYDAERNMSDLYFRESTMSAESNAVTVVTPPSATAADATQDLSGKKIQHVSWTKRGNQLELFWNAPETFHGKIEYEIWDKIKKERIGCAQKLPLIIAAANHEGSIFAKNSGKYIIGVRPVFKVGEDEKTESTYGKDYDVQITIEDEKEDTSNASQLSLLVRLQSANTQRRMKVNVSNTSLQLFRQKLSQQFGLNHAQPLKIRIEANNQSFYVQQESEWNAFLANHSFTLIQNNLDAVCFIEPMVNNQPSNPSKAMPTRRQTTSDAYSSLSSAATAAVHTDTAPHDSVYHNREFSFLNNNANDKVKKTDVSGGSPFWKEF